MPNANGNDPTNGLFNETTPFHVSLAGHTLSQGSEGYSFTTFSPENGVSPPTYAITLNVTAPLIDGQPTRDLTGRVVLSFQDATGKLLALGSSLPSDWNTAEFTLTDGSVIGFPDLGNGFRLVHFTIDQLVVVPEPGGLTLALMCVTAVSAWRWRQLRRRTLA